MTPEDSTRATDSRNSKGIKSKRGFWSLRFAPPRKRAMWFAVFMRMEEPYCKILVLERRADKPQCEISIVVFSAGGDLVQDRGSSLTASAVSRVFSSVFFASLAHPVYA